jgi:hypothetical protein
MARGGVSGLVFVSDTTGTGHVTVGEPPFEALFVPAT